MQNLSGFAIEDDGYRVKPIKPIRPIRKLAETPEGDFKAERAHLHKLDLQGLRDQRDLLARRLADTEAELNLLRSEAAERTRACMPTEKVGSQIYALNLQVDIMRADLKNVDAELTKLQAEFNHHRASELTFRGRKAKELASESCNRVIVGMRRALIDGLVKLATLEQAYKRVDFNMYQDLQAVGVNTNLKPSWPEDWSGTPEMSWDRFLHQFGYDMEGDASAVKEVKELMAGIDYGDVLTMIFKELDG